MGIKKAVGVWIRVSTEDQAQGESPEHHEKRARLYAEAKGWEVKFVYHLEAVSGKSVMQHPEAKKMMEHVRSRAITGIIFSKLARLARNTRELLDFADFFRDNNADLISLQEAIDTSTPAGRLFYTMIAGMAQWEREEIASRVAASVPIRAKLGKPLGGQGAFGYRWVDKKLVLDEQEAPIRRLIYELFLKHRRKKSTAKELNQMGFKTRNGSPFSDTTIDRLIRDPTAKGEHISNYTKSLGDKKQWKLKPSTEWVINPCPPIVSAEVWNECNRILDDQLAKRKHPGRKAVHLLSGYIYCECGKKMYVYHEGQNQNYACKTCKNRISVADIDEIFHELLKSFLVTDEGISTFLQQANQTIEKQEAYLMHLQSRVTETKKKMGDLVNMRLSEELTRDGFIEHYKPLEDDLARINEEIPKLVEEIDYLKSQTMSSGIMMNNAKNLHESWPTLPFLEKRRNVEIVTERITIGKGDIAFKLKYLAASPKNGENSNTSMPLWLFQPPRERMCVRPRRSTEVSE